MGFLYFFGMLFNSLAAFALLAQGLAIRARFGSRAHPLIREYTRFVLVMGGLLLSTLLNAFFYESVISPWMDLNGRAAGPIRLFGLPPSINAILLPVNFLQTLFSPVLIALIAPGLYLSFLDYEGIPVSALQRSMARLTRALGFSLLAALLLYQLSYYAFSFIPTATTALGAITKASTPLMIGLNIFTYGSLIAWSVHALQTQVFKSNRLIERTSRRVMGFTLAALVLLVFQEASRLLSLELPPLLRFMACTDPQMGYFKAYWFLCGAWGIAGIVVLLKSQPESLGGGVPATPARDPATLPLPAPESLRGIFLSQGLSERESQVAALVVSGAGNKEIALAMDISYNTVKNHVASIFRKLGAGNRFELIRSLRGRG